MENVDLFTCICSAARFLLQCNDSDDGNKLFSPSFKLKSLHIGAGISIYMYVSHISKSRKSA